ncbi:MAG: TonB family protein [Bacteroidaceae bacterium]|nr:TonB family protein [Bacteroidaceae bacterium]
MKRLFFSLIAILSVFALSAQNEFDNEVMQTIMARRSIRKYLDKPVEHSKLEAIAKAGINAPSARNWQYWAVRIIEDQKLINDVSEVYKQANPEAVSREPGFKNMFRGAPNLICVCTPADGGFNLDAGLLGENMMLAAQSLGLGTCIQTGPVRWLLTNEKAKPFLEALDIPEGYKLLYVIAVGYPDEKPDAKPRDASKVKFIGGEISKEASDDDGLFIDYEESAQFPGGDEACMKWLQEHIKYPEGYTSNQPQGRVIVSFIVERDGSLDSIMVKSSPDPLLSEEAIRVVKEMPKWKPARQYFPPPRQGSEAVRARYFLPIIFRQP